MMSFKINQTPVKSMGSEIRLYFVSWFLLFACGIGIANLLTKTWMPAYQSMLVAVIIILGIVASRYVASKGIGLGTGIVDTAPLKITCKISLPSFVCLFIAPMSTYLAVKVGDPNTRLFFVFGILLPVIVGVIGILLIQAGVTKQQKEIAENPVIE